MLSSIHGNKAKGQGNRSGTCMHVHNTIVYNSILYISEYFNFDIKYHHDFNNIIYPSWWFDISQFRVEYVWIGRCQWEKVMSYPKK